MARVTRFASCGAHLVVCDAPVDSALRLLVGRVQMSAPPPGVGNQEIGSGAPVQSVGTAPADEDIVAESAIEPALPCASRQKVVAVLFGN